MKIKGIELEYDDLVTLFSDGTYNSPLEIKIVSDNSSKYSEWREKLRKKKPNACIEDVWVEWLIDGGSLKLDANDCYEDDEDYEASLVAKFDLKRVNEMIEKAYNDKEVRWNVDNLINGQDDFYTGYNLLQYIAFGEIVLG